MGSLSSWLRSRGKDTKGPYSTWSRVVTLKGSIRATHFTGSTIWGGPGCLGYNAKTG